MIPDFPNITTHNLLSSYHDGLKEAVDFVKLKILKRHSTVGFYNIPQHATRGARLLAALMMR
ncbi:hypothetical protein DSCO28_38730 [Desulfosarcina ovata subsp. sediminis]|uniref:Uncharacterized protein n=1 Tax=Desulfosarcina ovata subsp. sediminis TaxID=885957 RepID=A0A5K7ZSV6_9BACT|nr:hypothetical protein DSCO28_38730 [Desulfosarcina ovata subsp. sediminis]